MTHSNDTSAKTCRWSDNCSITEFKPFCFVCYFCGVFPRIQCESKIKYLQMSDFSEKSGKVIIYANFAFVQVSIDLVIELQISTSVNNGVCFTNYDN